MENHAMDVGITVEERRWRILVPHGIAAGLCAGVALGLVQFVIAAAKHEGALLPFRLVASLAVGHDAFAPHASTALVMGIGAGIHLALAALFGVIFVVLLAMMFQLSARTWLLMLYGFVYGFLLWEVNFLAILPGIFPDLAAHFGLAGQIGKGIAAYALVYGPALGLYMAATRPGVISDWKQ